MDKQTLISRLLRVDNNRYLTNWWRKYQPDIKLLSVVDRKEIKAIKRDLKEKFEREEKLEVKIKT